MIFQDLYIIKYLNKYIYILNLLKVEADYLIFSFIKYIIGIPKSYPKTYKNIYRLIL